MNLFFNGSSPKKCQSLHPDVNFEKDALDTTALDPFGSQIYVEGAPRNCSILVPDTSTSMNSSSKNLDPLANNFVPQTYLIPGASENNASEIANLNPCRKGTNTISSSVPIVTSENYYDSLVNPGNCWDICPSNCMDEYSVSLQMHGRFYIREYFLSCLIESKIN